MKKFAISLILMTLVIFLASSSIGLAEESADRLRNQLDRISFDVLNRMYNKFPETYNEVGDAYAYCTISSSSVKLGRWDSDHGRGVAVNNVTGKKVYVKMHEVKIGLNIGAKEYDLLFIITDETAWKKFVSGKIKFDTEVIDGVNGDDYNDAKNIADGVYFYQLDKKGLPLDLTLKDAKISPIRSLNK